MRWVKTVPWMWKPSLPVRFHWIRAWGRWSADGPYRRNLRTGTSGKTTLTLQVIAAAQREGKPVRLSMLNTRWTQSMHVNWARYRQPAVLPAGHRRAGTGNRDALARSGAVDVIVVDSVAA